MSRKLAICLAVAIASTSVIGDSAFAERKGRDDRGKSAEKVHHADLHRNVTHRNIPIADRAGPRAAVGEIVSARRDRAPDLERVLDMILKHKDKDEDRAKLGAALKFVD